MPEEEKESEDNEKKTPEEKMKEMEEKVKEMYGQGGGGEGGGQRAPGPGPMGQASLMSRMASMRGGSQGGQQSKILLKTMKELRADMQEVKDYLRKILETLEDKE